MTTLRTTARRSAVALGTGALAVLLAAGDTGAWSGCQEVRGRYHEEATTEGCDSRIGLCITAEYTAGPIEGTFFGRATSLVESADTPDTAVSFFTTDSTIEGRVLGREGTLLVKNAGAFRAAGLGEIVDIQTIIGGTGELAGATGVLRASGTFTFAAGGDSDYEGTVCIG